MEGRTEMTVYEGMKGIPENGFINVKNRSFVVTADVEIPKGGAKEWSSPRAGRWAAGVFMSRTAHLGSPTTFSVARPTRSLAPLPCRPGKVILRFEFAYDGGRPGAGGNGSIFVNGEKVATGRIEHTHPNAFGAETTDVGENLYTAVSDDYKVGDNKFTGKINKVIIQVGNPT